ncbi:hypothetical protein [Noviherbaspirillum galbum]|uniref:Uncharacterized protein n=1 Tax=Noviherbaspirillum galbum TaxID=2709383 RepID=A0A6B3SHL6_9BURK|nr:hypothetical protein [Noviherbaspirillum galbum]NEX60168.1 hypothetical protein [Noviherbaspirillum galbum]
MQTAVVEKTREEVEALKRNWQEDPCWDLGETEGFEAHRAELAAFQTENERIWRDQAKVRQAKQEQDIADKAIALGIPGNIALAGYILDLERRISNLESKVLPF